MSKDSTIKTIVFANDHAQQKITSQDVAKLAGVSQSAVMVCRQLMSEHGSDFNLTR